MWHNLNMKAYSIDLRERVLHAGETGRPLREVSQTFQVSVATIIRWKTRRRVLGHVQPTKVPGLKRRIAAADQQRLQAQLEAQPDATLQAHCQQWQEQSGQALSVTTMWRSIQRLGWTRKKRV